MQMMKSRKTLIVVDTVCLVMHILFIVTDFWVRFDDARLSGRTEMSSAIYEGDAGVPWESAEADEDDALLLP